MALPCFPRVARAAAILIVLGLMPPPVLGSHPHDDCDTAADAGGSHGAATPRTVPVVCSGEMRAAEGDTADFYRFFVPEGTRIVATLTPKGPDCPNVDMDLLLYDPLDDDLSGHVWVVSRNPGCEREVADHVAQIEGDWRVRVDYFATPPDAPYDLTVHLCDPELLYPEIRRDSAGNTAIHDDQDCDDVVDSEEFTVTLPDGDADQDGSPDSIESELCGRAVTRTVIASTGPLLGHACESTRDYRPTTANATLWLVTAATLGPDADGDGFARQAVLDRWTLTVRPFGVPRLTLGPAPDLVVDLDPDDADPNNPVASALALPASIPLGVASGPDEDMDDVPATVILLRSNLTVDRRAAPYLFFSPAPSQSERFDPDDADPSTPIASRAGPVSIPTRATHAPDADNDGVPRDFTVDWLDVSIDRRRAAPQRIILESHSSTSTLDPDDQNRGAPVPFDAFDGDADFVPDAAEPWICQVQNENSAGDGRCVRPDGTGADGSGLNYVPPVGVPNPWNPPQ